MKKKTLALLLALVMALSLLAGCGGDNNTPSNPDTPPAETGPVPDAGQDADPGGTAQPPSAPDTAATPDTPPVPGSPAADQAADPGNPPPDETVHIS